MDDTSEPLNNDKTDFTTKQLNEKTEELLIELPCRPEKPADTDCCGSGCMPCIFDIYEQEVKIWELECARLKNKALFGKQTQV